MKGWKDYNIGDLCSIKHGWAFQGEYFTNAGDFILLTPGNFFEQGGFRQQEGKEKFYTGKFPKEYLLKENDIVIAMTEQGAGLLGSPALVPLNNRYLHNQRLGLFCDFKNDLVVEKYLYYLFFTKNIRQEIAASATGTKVKHTAPKRIYSIKVNLPPISTQTKIISILSSYDELIENNLQRIKVVDELLQKSFESSFTNPSSKEIPILEIAEFIKGFEPGSNNYLKESSNETIPFLRVGDLNIRTSGIFILKELSQNVMANNSDILLSLDGTVGLVKIGLYGAYSSGVRKVVSKSPLHKAYIYAYLKSQHGQNTINTFARGSTILHAGSAIPKMKIRLPEKKLMNEFASFANPSLELIINLMKQNKMLQEVRDILLPRLMTGIIKV